MSEAAFKATTALRLRVVIHAANSTRHSELSKLVAEAGHLVIGGEGEADVVLWDGDCLTPDAFPNVTLGAYNNDGSGALPRHASASQIDAALRAVAAGLMVRSPQLADSGFSPMRESDTQTLLTPRELEVLAAMADGMTNKLIARRLDISLHTVKFHVESVFRKMGAHNRAEAVAKALERRRQETIIL
jgi:two-component system nitrate/nitrite response regulator NarL